jgi:hypothetical protein
MNRVAPPANQEKSQGTDEFEPPRRLYTVERQDRQAMKNPSFTTTFSVDHTPEEAFKAILNVRGCWSEEIEGDTNAQGDEFTYRYQDIHFCRLKRVVWLVLENHFNFTADDTEWTGTKVTFEITANEDKTEIHFTHFGLFPEYECYGVCSNAWGSYINGSLRSLITTGRGRPQPEIRKRRMKCES